MSSFDDASDDGLSIDVPSVCVSSEGLSEGYSLCVGSEEGSVVCASSKEISLVANEESFVGAFCVVGGGIADENVCGTLCDDSVSSVGDGADGEGDETGCHDGTDDEPHPDENGDVFGESADEGPDADG
jgi:hypothetical protein